MFYNRFKIAGDMVYSIDYLQIDFGISCLAESDVFVLFGCLDFEKIRHFGSLDCDSGKKKLATYELRWWQFGGFHVEVWPRSTFRDIGVYRPDECGYLKKTSAVVKEVHWVVRLKFNPNKNFNNPALKSVLRFLVRCGWVNGWHFSRVDYALDVQGPLSAFYVLSRKTESHFGTTRYYGVRGTSGYLRVYDKRQEQKDKAGEDIGFEWTRFEWEQRGNRDFEFTFDQFSRMDFSGLDGATRVLRYVSPEFISHAISEFSPNYRAKLKKKLFSPVTVKKELFCELLNEYIKEYSLEGLRTFTEAQLFEMSL